MDPQLLKYSFYDKSLPRVFYSLNSECLSNTSGGLMKTLPRGAVTQPRARHIPV